MEHISFQEAKKILILLSEDDSKTSKDVELFFNKFLINKPQPIFEISESAFFIRCSINSDSINSKSEDIVFNKVSRCSYNPNPENIGLQRCNYENQTMFYAALTRNDTNTIYTPTVAILETCWDVIKNKDVDKKYFTISKWKINRPLQMIALPFSDKAVRKNPDYKLINVRFKKHLKNLSKNNDEFIEMYSFLKFISDIFCDKKHKEKKYKISSAFFNSHISLAKNNCRYIDENLDIKELTCNKLDGILYPSANTNGSGINVCLLKEVIDNRDVEYEVAVMHKMQRDKRNLKHLDFTPASSEAYPDANGNIHFQYIW